MKSPLKSVGDFFENHRHLHMRYNSELNWLARYLYLARDKFANIRINTVNK